MSPEQIAAMTAIAALLDKIGTWPIGSIFTVTILAPYIMIFAVSRSMEKRHTAALRMYENNVKMVEKYDKMAGEQVDTIRLSIAATTELVSWLKNRTPCHQFMAGKMVIHESSKMKGDRE